MLAVAAALQLPLVLELVKKAAGKKKAKGEQAAGQESLTAGQSGYAAKAEKTAETKTGQTEQIANTGKSGNAKHYRAIFFTACVLLTILTGLLIPSYPLIVPFFWGEMIYKRLDK